MHIRQSMLRSNNKIKKNNQAKILKKIYKYRMVYFLILPTVVCYIIFSYLPMVGILMAFKDYQVGKGFMGIFTSPGVGFDHFKRLFNSYYFFSILRNTVLISFYKIIFCFPIPIIFAILLNELEMKFFKRFVQTVTYLPHFLSTVVVTGLVLALLSPSYGLINAILGTLGFEPVHFLANSKYFRSIIVAIDVWKGTGWSAVIYLAAISSIDPQLYESATIDGAGKLRQIWSITLPSLLDLIILLLILRVGDILNAGFEQIFLLYSPPVYSVGDILDTFVYREGLVNSNYGFSTAVGLFKSIVGFVLIIGSNKLANKFGRQGIW